MSQSTWNERTSFERSRVNVAPVDMVVPVHLQYVIACLLLSIFRLGGLTHQSLWSDEGYTLHLVLARTPHEFIQIFGAYTTSEHLQPLYYVLMYGWSRISGDSDAALRLPSALLSIGSGLCVFAVLREIVGRSMRAYAMVGVGLFAIGSYSVFYAQEARPYACIQFCSFLFVLAWLYQARENYASGEVSNKRTALFVVAAVLACLSSIFGLLLVVSVGAADLYRMRRDLAGWWTSWRASVAACFFTCVAYAGFAAKYFPSVVAKDIVALKQPLWMNAAYTTFGVLFGTTLGPSTAALHGSHKIATIVQSLPMLLPAGIVIAAIIGVLVRFGASSMLPFYAKVSGLAAILYAFLLFGGFGFVGNLNVLPRHASALFALGVLTVAGCALDRGRNNRTTRTVLLGCLIAVFVLNAASVSRSIFAASCRKDDYRAAAAVLSKEDAPVFLTAGQPLLFQHYGLKVRSAVDEEPSHLAEYLTTASGTAKQIVVVTNTFRNYRWDNGPTVESVLAPSFTCGVQNELAYFEVLSCTRRDVTSKPAQGLIHD